MIELVYKENLEFLYPDVMDKGKLYYKRRNCFIELPSFEFGWRSKINNHRFSIHLLLTH